MAEGGLSNLTDEELLPAWDQVLEEFATALVRLHIACGAPPRSALAKQVDKGDRCRLPASTLSEVFNGKKISGIDFTMSGSEEAGNSPVALPAGPGDEEEGPWLVGRRMGGQTRAGSAPIGFTAVAQPERSVVAGRGWPRRCTVATVWVLVRFPFLSMPKWPLAPAMASLRRAYSSFLMA